MLTSEPVLTEALYFLHEDQVEIDPLFQLIERDALRLEFALGTNWPRVRTLMGRCKQMDLADASIVAMSELYSRCQVLTVDRNNFSIYRLFGWRSAPDEYPQSHDQEEAEQMQIVGSLR